MTPKFYVGMEIALPSVEYLNRREIFVEGSAFRQIGHGNGVIEILWLVAHIALSLFWLREFDVDFRSVIFVKGKTNLFKTTVVSLIANIFAKNRRKAGARLSSTKAYTQEFVTKLRDNVVLLDDFSNTVGASNNFARDNAETAIRVVGDGMFSGKMNVTNLAEGRADDREFYRQKFSVPRFIDAISTMAVEIDLILAFGKYCGMSDNEMATYREHALNAVENVMQQNLTRTKEKKPEVRFLHALKQNIGITKYNRLATTESAYVADSSSFIGFREETTNMIWLRFDDAYKQIAAQMVSRAQGRCR